MGRPARELALLNLQNLLGTCPDAEAAGRAFRGRRIVVLYNDAKGTYLGALAALGAELFVNHIHALSILGNGAAFAYLGAFAALRTYLHLGHAGLALQNMDAGFVWIKLFIESLRARDNAGETCGASVLIGHCQFSHRISP